MAPGLTPDGGLWMGACGWAACGGEEAAGSDGSDYSDYSDRFGWAGVADD